MKTLRSLLTIACTLAFLVASASSGAAEAYKKNAPTNYEIATALQNLVREVDASAYVVVKATEKRGTGKVRMPGTPFVLNNVEIAGAAGESSYPLIDVTVFSTSGTLPKGAQSILRKVAQNYAEKVEITVEALPADFLAARNKVSSNSNVGEAKAWEAKFAEVLTEVPDLIEKAKQLAGQLSQFEFKSAKSIALGVMIASSLLFVLFVVLQIGMQRRRNTLLEVGLNGVRSALEQGNHGSAQEQRPSMVQASAPQTQIQTAPLSNDGQSLATIPEEGVLALLSDCYWSHQDNYGAFLWRRISAERKISLLNRMPALNDYGRFLVGHAEEDLGMDQDPSYLRPLPLWNLDMTELTEFTRNNPGIISRLSPLRLSALSLRPTERLSLYASNEMVQSQLTPSLPETKSPARPLKRALLIKIQSDEDELEILGMQGVTLAVMAQVPSLGWLLQLPSESIDEILKSLSARDIASAWIGPSSILNEISKHIAEKKLEMMKSQLERVMPSRESPVFLYIHQCAVEEIRRRQSETTTDRLEEELPDAS
ncbi:MAG: hypothetical protein WCI18_14730 [Pseudomonadota bacterium]